MKQLSLRLLIVFIALGAMQMFAQPDLPAKKDSTLKIGYVTTRDIYQKMPEYIKAQGDFEAYQNELAAQLDSMKDKYQKALADYSKQEAMLTEAKKKDAQAKLLKQRQDMEDFSRQADSDLQVKQEQLLKPVKEKVAKAIEDIAKEEGMKFVFDRSTELLVLYADAEFDITFRVLDKLKRGK